MSHKVASRQVTDKVGVILWCVLLVFRKLLRAVSLALITDKVLFLDSVYSVQYMTENWKWSNA